MDRNANGVDLTLALLRFIRLLVAINIYLCLVCVVGRRINVISGAVGVNVCHLSININDLSVFPAMSVTVNVEMTLRTMRRIYLRV